jgi:hypothetical protein
MAWRNPGQLPPYKGQRPYKAEIVIDDDSHRYPMVQSDQTDNNYADGAEFVFNSGSIPDLNLSSGEHRFRFEFVDDWGMQTDPNDIVAGEKVTYPEGEKTWIPGPTIMASTCPTLSNGTVDSPDGTANSATLWKFGVDYADANNDAPVYVNLYVGEQTIKLANLERATPKKDADGNIIRDVVRHKLGIRNAQFNGEEMVAEITREIDILAALNRDIVLSHVIVPDDLPRYRAIFRQRQLRYRIFVLLPDCAVAVARSKERTCFTGVTDEHWIRHFHDQLSTLQQQEPPDVTVYDNAGETADESTERILQRYQRLS